MIFWHTTDWQPAFKMWHELLHNVRMARQFAATYRTAKKPRLADQYHNTARERVAMLRNLLQVTLLNYANVPSDHKIPHVEERDAAALADTRIDEVLPDGAAFDVARCVLVALADVMTSRRCEPPFPKLRDGK